MTSSSGRLVCPGRERGCTGEYFFYFACSSSVFSSPGVILTSCCLLSYKQKKLHNRGFPSSDFVSDTQYVKRPAVSVFFISTNHPHVKLSRKTFSLVMSLNGLLQETRRCFCQQSSHCTVISDPFSFWVRVVLSPCYTGSLHRRQMPDCNLSVIDFPFWPPYQHLLWMHPSVWSPDA